MAKLLVAYATMAGSTYEVAQIIGEELKNCGYAVDVLPVQEVADIHSYAGVVVGAPMIMGWHRAGLGFLKKHRRAWQTIPVAVFVTAMSLTETDESDLEGVIVCVDPQLPKPPLTPGRLSLKERYARLPNYLQPILRAVRPAKPVSLGVFGGRLEYGRLKWWAVLFAMLVIQAPAGDRRNWPVIRSWASGLPAAFQLEPQPKAAGRTAA
jgi:menaquinone-dependent protoporphyrinogen IX oxidase